MRVCVCVVECTEYEMIARARQYKSRSILTFISYFYFILTNRNKLKIENVNI